MNPKAKEIAEELKEHAGEATRLLKMSKQIHQAEKEGLIPENTALDVVLDLNEQAIAELDTAIDLQKKLIAEHDK